MVKRFHRQLKASLAAHPRRERWTEALPFVLLGICSTMKEDLQCTSAELVCGSPLRLPGEFFDPSVSPSSSDPYAYLSRLRQCSSSWKPSVPRTHALTHSFIPKDLSTCTHVFVRLDSHRAPLQARYLGPYKVLSRREETFILQLPYRNEVVSIDRIKPAFFESSPDSLDSPDDFEDSPFLLPFVPPVPHVPDRPSSPTLPHPPSSSTDSPPPPPSPRAAPAPPQSQRSSGSSSSSSTSRPALRPAILRCTKSGRTVCPSLRFRL
ncbi:UNVERIFIED_CONTAM: hypothetical protein RMT77_000363 [Armadillidium vulgare]